MQRKGERYGEVTGPRGVVITFAEFLIADEPAERTVSSAVQRLARRGSTTNFGIVRDKLHAFEDARTFEPDEVIIRGY